MFRRKRQIDLDSYSGNVTWQKFRTFGPALWSLRILYVLIFLAVFADFLANEKPLYCKFEGKTHFPVLQNYLSKAKVDALQAKLAGRNWHRGNYDRVVWPLIPYSPGTLDIANSGYANPFKSQNVRSNHFHHWLGTNQIGNDLLAGLIHGTRTALLIGLVAMSIATSLGLLLGGMAGFFGDRNLKISLAKLVLQVIGILLWLFWSTYGRAYQWEVLPFWQNLLISLLLFIVILACTWLIAIPLQKSAFFGREVSLPVDIMIMRLIEIVNAIPDLLLLLVLIAIMDEPGIFAVMAVIGLISWTGIARFTRAEMLKIRKLEYIEAGRALGYSKWRLLFNHALPNAFGPALVAIAFGIAGAILAEATLSFIGIGIPAEQVTWGRQLYEARSATKAWWLAFFPGMAIFVTITVFNLLGEGLTNAMERTD